MGKVLLRVLSLLLGGIMVLTGCAVTPDASSESVTSSIPVTTTTVLSTTLPTSTTSSTIVTTHSSTAVSTTTITTAATPTTTTTSAEKASLKILAIGNSFSEDATAYLWNVCTSSGLETVVIGNMYIGGCSLDRHWRNMRRDKADYQYQKNTNGTWVKTTASVRDALHDEEWDVITIQQSSGMSGIETSYTYLGDITAYLKENMTNSDAKIYWHMTWAYQGDSTHGDFAHYDNDQTTMYEAIVKVTQEVVLKNPDIDGVIPAGTMLQNLRASSMGDTLTRDGYHLSLSEGRYSAALLWFATLTGLSPEMATWTPTQYPSVKNNLSEIYKAILNAGKTPFSVTS